MIELSDEQASLGPTVFKSPKGSCVVMTGKAGSGKTFTINRTFEGVPSIIRVAPTGLAASLIGGVTIDRMVPLMQVGEYFDPNLSTANLKEQLFERCGRWERDKSGTVKLYKNGHAKGKPMANQAVQRRFQPNRFAVHATASYVVVDEPFMIRCDKIDCFDRCMRIAMKKPHVPFGGVTVIFAGDPAQFGPVIVTDEDRDIDDEAKLKALGYKAPFGFLQAKVFEKVEPITVKLTKIFRQESKVDGNLLIRVATGTSTQADLAQLNQNVRKKAPFDSIVLTTNNYRANLWNDQQLNLCSGESFVFKSARIGTAGMPRCHQDQWALHKRQGTH